MPPLFSQLMLPTLLNVTKIKAGDVSGDLSQAIWHRQRQNPRLLNMIVVFVVLEPELGSYEETPRRRWSVNIVRVSFRTFVKVFLIRVENILYTCIQLQFY